MNRRTLIAAVAAVSLLGPGCRFGLLGKTETTSMRERSRQLTLLAAKEAGNIRDADARLTRQLNIADGALNRFSHEDGSAVIREVTNTLRTVGGELRDHTRVSGWVSASQLARRAADVSTAKEATASAEHELETMEDRAVRCLFVMGVAEEVKQLRGNADAAALIVKGGQWASSIEDRDERRRARLAFAITLFNLDAYDGGVATLRDEQDPAWSSDTLLALAGPAGGLEEPSRSAPERSAALDGVAVRKEMRTPAPAAPSLNAGANYGKALDFGSVFQGRASSAMQ